MSEFNAIASSNHTMGEFQNYEENPPATSSEEQQNYYPTTIIDPNSQPPPAINTNHLGGYYQFTSVPISPTPIMTYQAQPAYQQTAYTPTFLPRMMTYPCPSPYYVNPSPIQYTLASPAPMMQSPFGYQVKFFV